jgi:hypothetical protein
MHNFPNSATFKTAIRRDGTGEIRKQIGLSKNLSKIEKAEAGLAWATRRNGMSLVHKDGKPKRMITYMKNGKGKPMKRIVVDVTKKMLDA